MIAQIDFPQYKDFPYPRQEYIYKSQINFNKIRRVENTTFFFSPWSAFPFLHNPRHSVESRVISHKRTEN